MIGQKQVPSRKGGIEVAVGELAVRMVEKGHKVTLYNWRKLGIDESIKKKIPDKCYRGVHICEVPVFNIKGISAAIGSLATTICSLFKRYDCIHYHAEGPAVMLWIPHLLGIKTVVTIHGLDWQRSKWGRMASGYLKLGEKIAVLYADEIIVLSKAAQKYFWDTYRRSVEVISNGIEKPISMPADIIEKRWGLKKDNYILYLGRIVPEKGLNILLQAYKKVKTDKKLVIAGAPSDTETYYKKLLKISEDDSRVVFTGFVEEKILGELYSNSYLYCLPSEVEGMPISLLEAMSYGNCCLCSDIEECAEVIGNHGVLFKSGNQYDLYCSLQELCNEPSRVEQIRREVSGYVCEKYNWDKVTQDTLKVYSKKRRKIERKHQGAECENINDK